MSTTLLKLSSNNGISIGTSSPISNQIVSTKPLNLQSNNLLNNKLEQELDGKNQLIFTDSEGETIGWFGEHFYDNEYQALSMFSKRNISGTDYYNGFYLGINSNGNPVVTMYDEDCRKAWRSALVPDRLYYDASFPKVFPITLNSSAANYSHMRIYYANSSGVCSSVDVINPNGKDVDMFNGGTGNNNGLFYPQATSVHIEDTTIRISGFNDNVYTYYMDTSESTATKRTTTLRLAVYIYCVEAW